MEVEIDFTKSAQQNAEDYFDRSKKAKKKAEGAEKSIRELERRKKDVEKTEEKKKELRKVQEKKWYEQFNWFFASNGMLAIGGRSAQQNELLNSKHFDDGDLFFHSDIFGASVVILKGGHGASREVKEEVAQFAASYSKAWESGMSTVNVYSLKRDQVSKSKEKGSLGTGSFLLKGEREWYKNTALELCAFIHQHRNRATQLTVSFLPETEVIIDVVQLNIAPSLTCKSLGIGNYIMLRPGDVKKSDAAKYISKKLQFKDIDYIMQHLPAGSFSVKETP